MIALLVPKTALIQVDSSLSGAFLLTIPLILLFAARALDGITGGNVSVANAYLADVSMAASGNLGFIIGPAFAGILGGTFLGELLPVLAAMGISLVAIFVIGFMLKESAPEAIEEQIESCKIKKLMGQEHKECYDITSKTHISFFQILKLDNVPFMLLLYFIIFLAFNFFYVAFPVHAVKQLQWSLFELGIFFSVLGAVMVIVQGPVLSRISDLFSDGILTMAGCLLLGASFFFFTSSSIQFIYLGVVLFSSGNGIMWPSFLSILSKVAGKKYQGEIQGYASSAGSLASIIGLITGGFIYGWINEATFWIPGILILITFFLSFRFTKIDTVYSNEPVI